METQSPSGAGKQPGRRGGARPNAGRKPVRVNLEEVERLCARGFTATDLAAEFGCSVRTIENRRKRRDFALAEQRGQSKYRAFIRGHALKLVAKEDPRVVIHMEKRYCQPAIEERAEKGAENVDAAQRLREEIDAIVEHAQKPESE